MLKHRPLCKPVAGEEVYRTINRENKEELTSIGNVNYPEDNSKHVTLHHKAPWKEQKYNTPTDHEYDHLTTKNVSLVAQRTLQEEKLLHTAIIKA